MYNSLPYDPMKDFEPVIMAGLQPMVVVAKKDLPVAYFGEFVAYLKANDRSSTTARVAPAHNRI